MSDVKKVITNAYTILRETAGYGDKIVTIPTGEVCELVEILPDVPYSGQDTIWYKIKWRDYEGYVYSGLMDSYLNELPKNIVSLEGIQTPDKYDAEQYILWEKHRKLNMCGELCVSWALGKPLSEVLSEWERKSPNIVSRIFKGSVDRGTSAQALVGLAEIFGYDAETIGSYFKDPVLNRMVFTPQRVKTALSEGKHVVIGVKIGGHDGKVGTGKINHWVGIYKVDVYGDQASVLIYNPYNNKVELYSWDWLMEYSAGIDGLVIHTSDTWTDVNLGELESESVSYEELSVDAYVEPEISVEVKDEEYTLEEKVDILWKLAGGN